MLCKELHIVLIEFLCWYFPYIFIQSLLAHFWSRKRIEFKIVYPNILSVYAVKKDYQRLKIYCVFEAK